MVRSLQRVTQKIFSLPLGCCLFGCHGMCGVNVLFLFWHGVRNWIKLAWVVGKFFFGKLLQRVSYAAKYFSLGPVFF